MDLSKAMADVQACNTESGKCPVGITNQQKQEVYCDPVTGICYPEETDEI